MPEGFMTAGPGCCCICWRLYDTFNKSDADPYMPSGWEKVGSGDITLNSNGLVLAATPGLGLVTSAVYDNETLTCALIFDNLADGEEAWVRVVFAYEDADNYYCIEMRAVAETIFGSLTVSAFCRYIKRDAGVETLLGDAFKSGRRLKTDPTDHNLNQYVRVGYTSDNENGGGSSYARAFNILLHYEAATGWLLFSPLREAGDIIIEDRFTSPPASGKIGIILGATVDADVIVEDLKTYDTKFACDHEVCPTPKGFHCYHGGPAPPTDEIELTISDIGTGGACNASGLNDTYVLTLVKDWYPDFDTLLLWARYDDPTITGDPDELWNLPRYLYRYELPVAICGVKYIDVVMGIALVSTAPPYNPSQSKQFLSTIAIILSDATTEMVAMCNLDGKTLLEGEATCAECNAYEYYGGSSWRGIGISPPDWELDAAEFVFTYIPD